ncbi:MAG: 2-phospho-L-lactate guanylyltransferase [Kiritimatiellae bacterium]|nr:2-phospho-L-lactate guanylyltransferase [Kiritimatiellia bacterium]
MKDLNIVIPVKNPGDAKERLSEVLTSEQRIVLAISLFQRVLAFFQEWNSAYHILVVTDSDRIEELANKMNATVLKEEKATGETDAIERAIIWSMNHGFNAQLVIPGDMAELNSTEMEILLKHPRSDPSVILCPATGDDGTNAVLSTPPNAIPFRFGLDSFPDYQERAQENKVRCQILRLQSFILDLDTPADLKVFLKEYSGHPIHTLLTKWKIHEKL